MKDKLCVFERRTKMLIYITTVKYATRLELAEEFNVSLATINRDVVFLSTIAPIYTKQGNGGGIYILPEYRSYKNYLTDAEEDFLYNLMQNVSNKEKRILCSIITKFTKNPLREYSVFQNPKTDEEGFDEGSVQR
ncbi:MAG: HTH domain-containing protein [Clostridia bacterium]|nr:HTH domain-containing protein [Clostridia bacterium]